MSMTWREIRDLFRRACATGDGSLAVDEQWPHLNNGYRKVCGMLELPELHVPNATVSTVANQDWIAFDCDIYSLDFIVDQSTGRKLDPETAGMRGRARYFEDGQVRPPVGVPSYYARSGNRIYLRDTPEDVRTLVVSYRAQPAALDDDTDLSTHPITPPQYDMGIVYATLESYYSLHPPQTPDGLTDTARSAHYGQLLAQALGEVRSPVTEEQRDRRDWVQQGGYDFSVWGR